MRVSKQQAAENRRRIVDTAGALFRERGFNGIGVADLMKEAGLTHGGFYGHFGSKDDLAAEAVATAMATAMERWEGLVEEAPGNGLAVVAGRYLSAAHRDAPAAGCAIAALGVDAGRQQGAVRRALTDGIRSLTDLLARLVPGRTKATQREKALATLSGLVGALVLARAVDDPALSDEILAAARTAFGAAPE